MQYRDDIANHPDVVAATCATQADASALDRARLACKAAGQAWLAAEPDTRSHHFAAYQAARLTLAIECKRFYGNAVA